MKRTFFVLCTAGAVGWGVAAFGHGKSTERYIPVGRSPDSGKFTVLGTIEAVDASGGRIRISQDGQVYTVVISAKTRVWLDRSKLKATNLEAGIEAAKPGLRAEARCAEARCAGGAADWLKIEVKN